MSSRSATALFRRRWHVLAWAWAAWGLLFGGLVAYGAAGEVSLGRGVWLGAAVVLMGLTAWRLARLMAGGFAASGLFVDATAVSLLWAAGLSTPWVMHQPPAGVVTYAVVLGSFTTALMPLVLLISLLLRCDFAERCTSYRYVGYTRTEDFDARAYPRPAEFAFWTFLLFPFYPWVRAVGRSAAGGYVWLMLLAAGVIGLLAGTGRTEDFPLVLALAWACFCGRRLAAAAIHHAAARWRAWGLLKTHQCYTLRTHRTRRWKD